MQGKVVRVISGFYDIRSNDKEYRTRGSGNLRNLNIAPLVGDIVDFEEDGFLTNIHKRKNFLIRPKVANVDQAVIIQSLKNPDYSSLLLNKFLAIIENKGIDPIIVFTKSDLVDFSPEFEYKKQGYKVFSISNQIPGTLDKLRIIFKDKLSVFTGQTGAGKSSTINNLASASLKTQEISKSLGRGKHTTRVVEIVPWLEGELIDTPGFSSLALDMSKFELSRSYHDFKEFSSFCKFSRDCIHDKEEDCEIKKQVALGTISETRYNDYLKLLKEAK